MEFENVDCKFVNFCLLLVLFSAFVMSRRHKSDETVMSSMYSDSEIESSASKSVDDDDDRDTSESEEKLDSSSRGEQKIQLNEDHEPIRIYYHKEDALRSFHMETHKDFAGREEFLFAYHNVCMAKPLQPPPWYKRKLFVVVESNNMTGRDILARVLSRRLRALFLTNPPTCLNPVRKYFIGTALEGAFRALGMYASAYHTRLIWNIQPVVMTGYWFDQTAYVMVMIARDESLPKDESPLFNWPKDLTCPDIMFYIHYDMPVPRRDMDKNTHNAYIDLTKNPTQRRPRTNPDLLSQGRCTSFFPHGDGRDILARVLSRRLRALFLTNPPTCLNPVRKYFIGTELEGAFRALGMYASAYHTRLIWNIQPVVMTGYWFDQTAYVMVMIARDESLPKDESPLFNWPRDLTCPDIMFYIHYDMPVPRRDMDKNTHNAYIDLWDESYKQRQKHKRLAKVYEKLSYMAKPLLFRIHTSAANTSHVVPQMEKHIMDELYIKFDFKIKFYDD